MDLVRKLREQKGWSQNHLAVVAEVGKRTIQRIERGKVTLSPETAMALADALGVTPGELVQYSGLRARLRTLVINWQRQPPTPEELEKLPDDLKAMFATYYEGTTRLKTEEDELKSIEAKSVSLHDESMKCMHEDAKAWSSFLTSSDHDTKLRLLREMMERTTLLKRTTSQSTEVSRKLFELASGYVMRAVELVQVAAKLDAALHAYGV